MGTFNSSAWDMLERELEESQHACARYKELYESAIAVTQRLQKERDNLLDRVEGALRGIDDAKALPQLRAEMCPFCNRMIEE